MMQRDPIEQRLLGPGLPEPAADLRDRVLAAALPLLRPSAIWADRMWFSRRWRLAAIALLLVLVVLGHFSAAPGSFAPSSPDRTAVETAQAVEEAARQVGLPPDQAAALARRALIAASRPAARSDPGIDPGFVGSDFNRIENP